MISAKSILRPYQQPILAKLHAVEKLYSLHTKSNTLEKSVEDQQLSREQVLEIYDWVAQLRAQ